MCQISNSVQTSMPKQAYEVHHRGLTLAKWLNENTYFSILCERLHTNQRQHGGHYLRASFADRAAAANRISRQRSLC